MFTGLIQQTGELRERALHGAAGKLLVRAERGLENPKPGESIAVNGACLTLEKAEGPLLWYHVMQETFEKTNLGILAPGSILNLERALSLGDRLGGHLVSGHVDARAHVISFERKGADMELKIVLPPSIAPFLVPKGSICVNGVSLTLSALSTESFAVRIIPTTWNETNLRFLKSGSTVNLEADLLGKYVRFQLEAMLGRSAGNGGTSRDHSSGRADPSLPHSSSLSMDDLKNAGFLE